MVKTDTSKQSKQQRLLLGLVVLVAIVAVAIGVYKYNKDAAITSYDECVAAGHPVEASQQPSCSVPTGSTFTRGDNQEEPPINNQIENQYVGLSEQQAQELAESQDRRFRVTMRDGEGLPMTMDFVKGRINADVEDGEVVKIQIEGQEKDS